VRQKPVVQQGSMVRTCAKTTTNMQRLKLVCDPTHRCLASTRLGLEILRLFLQKQICLDQHIWIEVIARLLKEELVPKQVQAYDPLCTYLQEFPIF
jgi:hypothetical protein